MRETPFTHFDSTLSCIPANNITIAISHFSWAGSKTEQGERRADPMSALRYPTSHPHDIAPQIISHLSTTKVSSTPRRTISRRRAPLEECLSCILRNHFSIHSLFSYFAIASTGEGGGRSYISRSRISIRSRSRSSRMRRMRSSRMVSIPLSDGRKVSRQRRQQRRKNYFSLFRFCSNLSPTLILDAPRTRPDPWTNTNPPP